MLQRAVLVVLALSSCTSYEYEEEVFLDVNGSGRIRISGSSPLLERMHGADGGTPRAMAFALEGEGLEIDSIRETTRDGRRFVHVEGSFDEWNDLCRLPAFRDRECWLTARERRGEEELALHLTVPAQASPAPETIDPKATMAFRFHFPSAVTYHNSRIGIERGNIIGWERTVAEHFNGAAADIVVEARFEQRSVLATTLVVLGTAIGIVLASVTLAILLMVRKGRRQLAEEGAGLAR